MGDTFEQKYEKALLAVKGAEEGRVDIEARGTCQACLGGFVAKPVREARGGKSGSIAMVKHGFERPGWGYLIGECQGTGHPPFELSCEFTKEFLKRLREKYLPDLKEKLALLKADKWDNFVDTVYNRKIYKNVQIPVTRGKPLPAAYAELTDKQPNWESLRRYSISMTERAIEALIKDIEWLDQRVKNWRYAPDLLSPKEKDKTPGQTMRQWLEGSRAELSKLPAPTGWKWTGANFWEWAMNFPRTLAYVAMRTHSRNPYYYKSVRDEYEKMTGAKPLEVGRPPRERAAISREQAEKEAERAKKLAEREKVKNEKDARLKARTEKALADIVKYKDIIATVFKNADVVARLKANIAGSYDKESSYDYLVRRGQDLHTGKVLNYITGQASMEDTIVLLGSRYRPDGNSIKLQERMKDYYEDVVYRCSLVSFKVPKKK